MRVCVCKRVGTFPTVSIPMRDQIGVSDWHKVSNKLKYYKTKLYILQMIAMKFVFTAEHTEMSHFHCIYAALHTFFSFECVEALHTHAPTVAYDKQ